MKILSANIGFVTNSSSVVYHFPREVVENEDIQAFIKAFEIEEGYVGNHLWNRSSCQTFALTKEQKQEVNAELSDPDYGSGLSVNTEDDSVVMVYGDEYHDITSILIHMMVEVAKKMDVSYTEQDFN